MQSQPKISHYIRHLDKSINNAKKNISKLTDEILKLNGSSSSLNRHFFNNLVNFPNSRVLEIGSNNSDCLSSLLYNNIVSIVSINDWTNNNIKHDFLINYYKYKKNNKTFYIDCDWSLINSSCFTLGLSVFPNQFNIFFYNFVNNQLNALSHFIDCLDDLFIFITPLNNEDIYDITSLNIKKIYSFKTIDLIIFLFKKL